jgi:shikimate kinase
MKMTAPLASGVNVALIGFRATGKSSVGRRLAQILGRRFVDLDQVLVQEARKSVAKIVAQAGWEEFRRREKALVARFAPGQGLVLATGGGVVLDPDNVSLLKAHSLVIWLTAGLEIIQTRLVRDLPRKSSRPSLTGHDPVAEAAQVLAARQPLYMAAAHLIIDTTNLAIPQVVGRILAVLGAKEAVFGG